MDDLCLEESAVRVQRVLLLGVSGSVQRMAFGYRVDSRFRLGRPMTREEAQAESQRRWQRKVKNSRHHGYMVGVIQWSSRAVLAKGTSSISWEAAFADADKRAAKGEGK